MFDSLSERLGGILDRLTRRGALTEADVDAALREVRRALLEADVALDVVRAFVDKVKSHAVGIEVIKSVTPGQMVVKIVHDQLIETLGARSEPIDLNAPAPGRFSTTNGLPKRSDSFCPNSRPRMSVPPPGANGTMKLTCRLG